ADASGLIALADDTGLELAAYGGWPGVHSVRFAGPDATDAIRRRLVLDRLKGRTGSCRLARFVCSVVLAKPNRVIAEAEGVLPGRIAEHEHGDLGFGFDSIFVP